MREIMYAETNYTQQGMGEFGPSQYTEINSNSPVLINIEFLIGRQMPYEYKPSCLRALKDIFKQEGIYPEYLDPITITPYPYSDTEKYLIIDGHHRARAAGILPDKRILARIISNQEAYDLYSVNVDEVCTDVDNARGAFAKMMSRKSSPSLSMYDY